MTVSMFTCVHSANPVSEHCTADRQLVFGYRITGRQQCFRFFQLKGHIQQEFFGLANALCAIIQFYGLGLLRSYFRLDHACLNHFAVSQQFPFCIVTVQVTEEVFVVYVYDTVSQARMESPRWTGRYARLRAYADSVCGPGLSSRCP